MTDLSHLVALKSHLANERVRLADAKSKNEIAQRTVWVRQLEKEIAGEEKFLGISAVECNLSDDDLLAELMA